MKIRQIISVLAILILIAVCVLPVAAEEHDAATDYFNLAERSLSNGDKQAALEYFNKALASNTTNMSLGDALMFTYKDKTGVLVDLGRYDEAIQTADQGLVLYPKSPGLWNNKGYAYFTMGKYSDAVDAYNNAVRIDPSYLNGWINKGNALVKAGRGTEAVDAYNKVLELDPGNPAATAGLTDAKKLTDSSNLTTIIALIAILVIAAGFVIWYVKFRKSGDEKAPEKAKGKK
jgi:tetratricopeptide (TPR) repeat protein